jgi:hypothetical protein
LLVDAIHHEGECAKGYDCAPWLAYGLVNDVAESSSAQADDGECAEGNEQVDSWAHDRGIVACSGVPEKQSGPARDRDRSRGK